MRSFRLVAIGALLLVAGPLALVRSATAAPSLLTGFTDERTFQGLRAPQRAAGLANARAANSSVIRVVSRWSKIAPSKPPDRATAQDPGWAGYDFGPTDTFLRETRAAGMKPMLLVFEAPAWAEGAGRPPVSDNAPAGTWRPSPSAFADFSVALARRYSGLTPDPLVPGANLPKVTLWQVWNEPNLTDFLTPQYRKVSGRFEPASSDWYRAMLDAVYPALKSVSKENIVGTGGLAPFGDLAPGGRRIPPAAFMRDFVCVRGRNKPTAKRCSGQPARFDALAAHPYPIGPPRRHAPNPDDVVVADLDRLTRPMNVAIKAGNVRPRKAKQLWATEISWDSRPDPQGLSPETQARYLSGALYVLWQQGVDIVTWFLLRDQAEGPGWGTTLQSGVYYLSGDPASDERKPSFTGFRFPFTAYLPRRGGEQATLWGLAPNPGDVVIEAKAGDAWRQVKRLRAGGNRVFLGTVKSRKGVQLRARQQAEASLPWTVLR